MGKDLLLLLLAIVVAGGMSFLLIFFLKRLKRIEKEMWEAKARHAKAASDKRKKQIALARKEAKAKKEEQTNETS